MKLDEDETLAAKKRAKEIAGKDSANASFLPKLEFLLTKLDEALKPYEQKAGITEKVYSETAKILTEGFKEADGDKVLDGFAKIGQMLRKMSSFKTDENGKTSEDTNFLDELDISNEEFAKILAKLMVMLKSNKEEDIESFKASAKPHLDKYLQLHPPPTAEKNEENQ